MQMRFVHIWLALILSLLVCCGAYEPAVGEERLIRREQSEHHVQRHTPMMDTGIDENTASTKSYATLHHMMDTGSGAKATTLTGMTTDTKAVDDTDWEVYHCYQRGTDDTCAAAREPSVDVARTTCNTLVQGDVLPQHVSIVFAQDYFGHGPCPNQTFHCRNGGPQYECTTFQFPHGTYDSTRFHDGDSYKNARDWCSSWAANLHLTNFSSFFGRGACPDEKPVYHCLQGAGGTCFSFYYGDDSRGYRQQDGYDQDTLDAAQGYCLSIDDNANEDNDNNSPVVFGIGQCP